MGNKQKSKKISKEEKNSKNITCYLLCPKCWKKIPYINTFIDGDKVKIKILCTCLENNNYLILNLSEYITLLNNKNISNRCSSHPDTVAPKFCMNCENWLCISCFSHHKKDLCISEDIDSNNDNEKIFCFIHSFKKIYFCKQCNQIFCKTCFLKHNVKNKKEHKAINIKYYLIDRKIKSKLNKFDKYKEEIINNYNVIKNDLLKEINSLENNNKEKEKNVIINEEIIKYKNLLEKKYLIHKELNEQLINLIEIIFKNLEYFCDKEILNRKYICNVIMNTNINMNIPKLNKNNNIIEKINYFIIFLNNNYINKKLNCKLSFISKYDTSNINSIIEMMLSLPQNKFVSINKDCAIQIWDKETKKNIYTLNEHSNNITSIILLKNKKYFATASDDSTIKIWDYSKGICIKTIITEGKPFLIYEIFNKENQIGCIPYRNSLAIYEYNESTHNKIINISLEKSIPWIEGLYQFPNDGRIILSTTGFFEVYSKEITKIKKIYIANDTPRIFLQLKNEDLAVGFLSKDIFIYDKNLMYKSRLCGHKKNITSIIQYDENKILTSSLDTKIFLWRMNDYEMIGNFIHNNYGINSMIIINKNTIVTSSYYKNNSIDEWNIEIYDNIN